MRVSLVVRGTIQGVGFRPFVRRAALARGLSGFVQNGRDAVRIEVQGGETEVTSFTAALETEKPRAAVVRQIEWEAMADRSEVGRSFEIIASDAGARVAPVLPADLATCVECWREVSDPGDRRYAYPFTNCVGCGPRFSICLGLPYDRLRTSMVEFPMCADCSREYHDLDDRRYHAQPIACPLCGPTLVLLDGAGRSLARGAQALDLAVRGLSRGRIVALKGLGGFQLLCLAGDEAVVARLRERKRRPHKPFAVMFRDPSAVRAAALLSEQEEKALRGPEAPIVLLERRSGATDLADAVAGGSPYVGALLPATPLHGLLVDRVGSPVVCTSGNVAEEPLCTTDEDATRRLAGIADVVLTHDRDIVRPLDDSIVRVSRGRVSVLRRARGHAPHAVARICEDACVLGFGAHLKSTLALGHAGAIVPSQHLGDLVSLKTRELFGSTLRDLCAFFDASPRLYACDLHPDYGSTMIAEGLAAEAGVPLLRVQHHHAHIAACMAEHGLESDTVLGLAWDGSGLGHDGTIWGGEALLCKGPDAKRIAHLGTFPLPGGDAATRDPRRVALGLLWTVASDDFARVGARWFGDALTGYAQMLEREVNSPLCSSVGRLFDAIAALVGVGPSTFEGQAAMELEALARSVAILAPYDLPLKDGVLDVEPLTREVLRDVARGMSPAHIARRFHEALVDAACAIAERAGVPKVALGGGCFQNRLLVERVSERLEGRGFEVLASCAVPSNDGGISVGQAWLAAQDPRSLLS